MEIFIVVAATLLTLNGDGWIFTVEGETTQVDPGRSLFLDATVRVPGSTVRAVAQPDFRDRVRGFSLAEDDEEEPRTDKDGSVSQTVHWRLVPEPCASEYKIAPFVVGDCVAGPIYFEPQAVVESVSGGLEVDPRKDMPPLNWRFAKRSFLYFLCICLAGGAAMRLAKYVARRVREHRMSPIERAWVELDRLLKKGLPGRGRYKDFYVELTQLVRRYVQRKYGIKAPHMTTEEICNLQFAICDSIVSSPSSNHATPESIQAMENRKSQIQNLLREFLASADMVKFAGVEATPEMADAATDSARAYLRGDSAADGEGGSK